MPYWAAFTLYYTPQQALKGLRLTLLGNSIPQKHNGIISPKLHMIVKMHVVIQNLLTEWRM